MEDFGNGVGGEYFVRDIEGWGVDGVVVMVDEYFWFGYVL